MKPVIRILAIIALLASETQASTAVITRPNISSGTEQFLANTSRHVFSGMSSYVAVSSPADGATRIARWLWTFPDGQTMEGGVVEWRPTSTGTGSVSLQVIGDDGSTSTAVTYSVTVAAAPTYASTVYVRSDGSDSNDGSFNHPWLALEHANYQWIYAGYPSAGWQVRLVVGQSVNYTGNNGWGVPPYTPYAYGPNHGLYVVTKSGTGSSANPKLLCSDGAYLGLSGDSTVESYSEPLIWDGIDVSYSTPQDQGSSGSNKGIVDSLHVHQSVQRCAITNASLSMQRSQKIVVNTTISGSADTGLQFSNGPDHCCADAVTCSGNGSSTDPNALDHQFYLSGALDTGVLDCVADGTGATNAYSGLKTSGCSRIYVAGTTMKANLVASDTGSNPTQSACFDEVFERCVGDANTQNEYYFTWLSRISIRNDRIYGGLSSAILWENAANAGDVDTIHVYHMSANLFTGQILIANTANYRNIVVKNSAFVKASGGGFFYDFVQTNGDSNFTSDYNVYWRVGGSTGTDSTFARINNTTYNWAQWKARGHDAHSVFADPLFTGAKNLLPKAGSPCLAAGTPLGVVPLDAAQYPRSTTAPGIGAFESTNN